MKRTPKHYNLSEYPLPDTDEFYVLPVRVQNVLENCYFFTEEATASQPGKPVRSRMYCEIETGKYKICEGDIELLRLDNPGEIQWECERCGDTGVITGFENSPYDLSGIPEKHARQFIYDKYVAPFEGIEFMEGMPFEPGNPEQSEEVIEWLESLGDEDKERIISLFEEELGQFDQVFSEEIGGLHSLQMVSLLSCDWQSRQSPLFLRDDLDIGEIEQTILFHNLRLFLLRIQQEGKFDCTQKGFLKRKHVSDLLHGCIWPEGYIEEVRAMNKVINEADVWLLHVVRVLLEFLGLIRKEKSTFKPVKKRAEMAAPQHAGKLYQLAVSAYFNKMNISFLSGEEEMPVVQEGIPYTFFRLSQLAGEWTASAELMKASLLEPSIRELLHTLRFEFEKPEDTFYNIILKPLELFGLMESKHSSPPRYSWDNPDMFRKTPLFDRFFEFTI